MRGYPSVTEIALAGFMLAACGAVEPRPGGGMDGGTQGTIDGAVDTPPAMLCVAPVGAPTAKVFINLFADAEGHSGPDNTCAKVGMSYQSSNPQYVFCRRRGGLVSGSQGFNHYWLWTELDSPLGAPAWISAYYLQGQGNDQADGIPDCP